MSQRLAILGVGLIGGSVALGLRRRGWHVSGDDVDRSTADAALDRGVVDMSQHGQALLLSQRLTSASRAASPRSAATPCMTCRKAIAK